TEPRVGDGGAVQADVDHRLALDFFVASQAPAQLGDGPGRLLFGLGQITRSALRRCGAALTAARRSEEQKRQRKAWNRKDSFGPLHDYLPGRDTRQAVLDLTVTAYGPFIQRWPTFACGFGAPVALC